MEKPLCTLCEKRHWGNEPHVFEEGEPLDEEPRQEESGQAARNRRYRQRHRERYNAYMRQYRRKKRL